MNRVRPVASVPVATIECRTEQTRWIASLQDTSASW